MKSKAAEDIAQQPARQSLAEQWPVIAFGTACITAVILRRAGLLRKPMPFDWIWTCPPMIRHCLRTDFSVLLDRTQYTSLTGKRAPGDPHDGCAHDFYAREFGMPLVFNHNDPTRDVDYRYLVACVDRFRDVILSRQANLFVQMREIDTETAPDFRATCALLDELTPNSAFLQIAVSPPDRLSHIARFDVMSAQGRHALYHMQPTSKYDGLGFQRTVDDAAVAALIANYGRHSPFSFRPEHHVSPEAPPGPVASDNAVRVMAHIADRGDTDPDENGWTGVRGCGLHLQGLSIDVNANLPPASIRYQVATTPTEFSAWAESGTYSGTRGIAKPIFGLRLSIAPQFMQRFRVSVELSFIDGTRLGPIAPRRSFECVSGSPLEAIRILAFEDSEAADRSASVNTSEITLRCGMHVLN